MTLGPIRTRFVSDHLTEQFVADLVHANKAGVLPVYMSNRGEIKALCTQDRGLIVVVAESLGNDIPTNSEMDALFSMGFGIGDALDIIDAVRPEPSRLAYIGENSKRLRRAILLALGLQELSEFTPQMV